MNDFFTVPRVFKIPSKIKVNYKYYLRKRKILM